MNLRKMKPSGLKVINENNSIPVIVMDSENHAQTFRNVDVKGKDYTDSLAYALNFCSNYNLCAGNAHDFIPSHILMLLQFQAIFGDA